MFPVLDLVIFCLLLQLRSVLCVDKGVPISPLTHSSSQCDEELQCPPGFFHNTTMNKCECYSSSEVLCKDDKAFLSFGNCMTYQKEEEGTILGACISFLAHGRNVSNRVYIGLPDNLTELNEYMCGPMNRKGLVCSECVDGFSPAITSFGFQCSNCTDAWYGVPVFLFLEFVPITTFYLIITTSGFSVTSAPMSSFVLYFQLAAHLFTAFTALTAVIENEYGSFVIYFIKVVSSLFGIWNLDFFRYIVPPFCISSNLKLLHVVCLYYISAFYPLCLIGITWTCIQLYSRNFRLLTWIWYHAKQCCCFARRKTDTKSTIIDVFATFFLLSFTKLYYTSLYILAYITLEKNGRPYKRVPGLDPTIEYFGKDHAPFAVISIVVLIGPVLFPVIVLGCYPMRAFRSLLEKCKVSGNLRAALNLFVEKFHSCYRDGLNGGKDMRSFVFLPFFLRMAVILGAFSKTFISFWFFHFVLYGGSSLLITIIQPYKRAYMNIIDALILAVLSLYGVLYILYLYLAPEQSQHSTLFVIALCINFILPLFEIIVIIAVKLVRNKLRTNWINICKKKLDESGKTQETPPQPENAAVTNSEVELPDRILHPHCYDGKRFDENWREPV